jgi:hypothetical protein
LERLTDQERLLVSARMREIAAGSDDDRRAWRFKTEADRFEKCGKESLVLLCEHHNLKFHTKIDCKSRICDDCGRSYFGLVNGRFADIVKLMMANRRKGYFCSLLTLTVTTDRFKGAMPGRSDIKRFYRESSDFLRLFCGRYRGVFTKKGRVREDRKRWIGAGSLSVVEVGAGNNNLHLHAVVYMPFTPLSVMRAAWQRITGDSYRVGLDAARSPKNVVNYILKYITKPPSTDSYADLADYAWMIKGTRRLRSTGMFYNHLALKKTKKLRCCCPYCSGRLVPAGFAETMQLESCVQALWKLLRRVADLGRNLLPPTYKLGQGWVEWQGEGAAVGTI